MVINLSDKDKKKVSPGKAVKTENKPAGTTVKTVVKTKSRKSNEKNLYEKNLPTSNTKKKSATNIKTADKTPVKKTGNPPEVKEEEYIDPQALERGDEPMTIVEHLDELRTRLIKILGSFFILTCIAFYFSDQLVYFINKPFLVTGNKLNVFTLVGGFMIKMKVAAAVAILILLPLTVYHIWRFISPAIGRAERFFSRITIFSAIMLFYAGVLFVFLLLPSTITVLLSFINTSMLNTIDANDYLHFIFFLSFVMGIICELPIIILILTKIGIITPEFLTRKRKYAIIIIWIIAAIVTPSPDFLSQSLVGVPMMLLYEVSIVISKIVLIRKKKNELKIKYS